ncbi:hypothetical protein MTBBW1_260001 [Desulfamplus magnetovallimortis]|uniref:Uncharacterized protein n=1 Tax=Desulfamplus magnetovallimortis TaxID=1246637 RepID=A0A1W1HEV6_9BACT|nr:hypothetical protein MTBBW1_260001 [Desulfamplus magnetovallimortis]
MPKTIIIESLKQQIEQLEKRNTELEQENKNLEEQKNDLATQNEELASHSGEVSDPGQILESSIVNGEEEYKEKIKTLEETLDSETQKRETAESELQAVKDKYQTLMENSGNVLQLTEEIEKLKEENTNLSEGKSFLDIFMTGGGDDVLKTAMIKWFLSGAGVLIAGWLIGRSFSGGSRRKRGILA